MAKEEIKQLSEEFLYILYNAALKRSNICGIIVENMRPEYLPDNCGPVVIYSDSASVIPKNSHGALPCL